MILERGIIVTCNYYAMKRICALLIVGLLFASATLAQPSSPDLHAEWRQNTLEVPAIKGKIGIADFAYTFFNAYSDVPICEMALALMSDPNEKPADFGADDFVLDRLNGYLRLTYDGDNVQKVEMRRWNLSDNHQLVAVNMINCDDNRLPLLMFYDFDPTTSLLSPLQHLPFDKKVNFRKCDPDLQPFNEHIIIVDDVSGDTALLHWNGNDGFVYDGSKEWLAKTIVLTAEHVGNAANSVHSLQTGDLIFVGQPPTHGTQQNDEMSSAIVAATGDSVACYFHVAIAEVVGEKVWIIDATSKRGVAQSPIDTFLCDCALTDSTFPLFQVMRLADSEHAAKYVERAKGFIGQPYDSCFLPGNETQYCSELIRNSYVNGNGEPLFHDKPMNFKSADGTFPRYWISWFEKIGRPIPQDVPGTNPNDMSKEKCLIKVDVDILRYSEKKD